MDKSASGNAAGVDIVLRDGSTVRVRPVREDDLGRLRKFLGDLTEDARWFRFFSVSISVEDAARVAIDAPGGLSLAVVTGADEEIVGQGGYYPVGAGRAEVAFAVANGWEDVGIATLLLAHLADAAADAGIGTFVASVLPGNHRMITVFRNSGYPVELRSGVDEIAVSFPTSLTPEGRRQFEERERISSVAAVAHILRPASLVVMTDERLVRGGATVANLRAGGYAGALHVVDRRRTAVDGVPAFPSLADLPGQAETAVIAVSAEDVVEAARACAEHGVSAIVVLSPVTGSREDLVEVCRRSGMRLLGPDSLGVLDTAFRLNATFTNGMPQPGRIAFASQSVALGVAALDLAAERSMGVSSFVSLGDRADLSNNDFLQYWEADSNTDVILLYLESFGNPQRFGQVARRVAGAKPLIAVKSRHTRAGLPADHSQTTAVLAASDTTEDALFLHAGVIRTETIGEMLDTAALLSRQPLPRGGRVAIVANGRGPGILCANACTANGLDVNPLGEDSVRALAAGLAPDASVENPIDILASAAAGDYGHALSVAVADDDVDAAIAIFVRPLATRAADAARAIESAAMAAADAGKPVLAVFMGADQPPVFGSGDVGVPRYGSPEEAARALGHAVRHSRRRAADPDPAPYLEGLDADLAAAIVARALGAGGGWLPPASAFALLRSFGLPVARSLVAPSAGEAARAAAGMPGPVAIKAVVPGLVHRADFGAVRLDLGEPTDVERAAREIEAAVRAAGHEPAGFLVQTMAPDGAELLVGVVPDPAFGPLVAVGAGGATAELIGDIEVRLAPIGPRAADEMIRSLRTFPLLTGHHGRRHANVAALEDVLLRVSALATAHPAIAELDCNPVIVTETEALLIDARVRIAPPPSQRTFGVLEREPFPD